MVQFLVAAGLSLFVFSFSFERHDFVVIDCIEIRWITMQLQVNKVDGDILTHLHQSFALKHLSDLKKTCIYTGPKHCH